MVRSKNTTPCGERDVGVRCANRFLACTMVNYVSHLWFKRFWNCHYWTLNISQTTLTMLSDCGSHTMNDWSNLRQDVFFRMYCQRSNGKIWKANQIWLFVENSSTEQLSSDDSDARRIGNNGNMGISSRATDVWHSAIKVSRTKWRSLGSTTL